MDVEWISSMAPGAKTTIFRQQEDRGGVSMDPIEAILLRIQQLAAAQFRGDQPSEAVPLVISVSYGGEEDSYVEAGSADHINEVRF